MNQEQEIQNLEKKVNDLLTWKNNRMRERLILPLDPLSRRALDYWRADGLTSSVIGLFVSTGRILNSAYLDLSTAYSTYGIEVTVNGTKKNIALMPLLSPFTVNTVTDFIINTNGQHNVHDGQLVTFTTDGTLPAPIIINVLAFVVNSTATTFQLSSSAGGPPIDITSSGSGTHYYAVIS